MMNPELFAVSPLVLNPGLEVPVDLFVVYPSDPSPVLMVSTGKPLTKDLLDRLEIQQLPLMAMGEGKKQLQRLLRDQLSKVIDDLSVPALRRAALLSEVTRGSMEEAYADGETTTIVRAAQKWGKLLAETLPSLQSPVPELCRVLQHDWEPYTHATNVAFSCCWLGHRVGFSQRELVELATGALLHDVGMRDLRQSIVLKPGKLLPEEFAHVKQHPTLGFRRLCVEPAVTRAQLLMAYQHHERLDGSGYPVGIPEQVIHPWAKLLAVVDVYQALTSDRPYRTAMNRRQAFGVMRQEAGITLDQEYLRCWEALILESTKN